MSLRSQLLKGILEGCILAIISKHHVYGYELSMKLQQFGLQVSEGSIYPVLLRLQKEKLISGEMQKSPSGPNRKYYFLTNEGKEALQDFREHWELVKKPVDLLIGEEIDHAEGKNFNRGE
ncbi:PadR family transcriptional regulator [Evansella cellulosilytica]|uniref:Transcriptional regulator, PadR-like family n=1 Tax=Evansella cellulosilytica (strain ATCC 21833 / DSM 2522 / FERM P-1141 / JCM 9156 / N-4) TaxID=649639 RepID=E6TQC5_EVAC2|nr:PadR family transcriptional regulator [Evansella cellulosilytica]ADU29303.1 transcriptional regulator, PadR-like family [Evansella cellulosilytica DSM 2522]